MALKKVELVPNAIALGAKRAPKLRAGDADTDARIDVDRVDEVDAHVIPDIHTTSSVLMARAAKTHSVLGR